MRLSFIYPPIEFSLNSFSRNQIERNAPGASAHRIVTANADDVRAMRGIVEPRARARCTGVMRAQCVHSRRSTVLRFARARNRQVYVTTTMCGIWKERAGRRDENAVRYPEGTGRSIRDDNDVRYLEGTGRSTGRQRRNRIRQVYITMTLRNVWQGV